MTEDTIEYILFKWELEAQLMLRNRLPNSVTDAQKRILTLIAALRKSNEVSIRCYSELKRMGTHSEIRKITELRAEIQKLLNMN